MSVPAARVVHEGKRLGPPPRHVPRALWLRVMTGGRTMQLLWLFLAGSTSTVIIDFREIAARGNVILSPLIATGFFVVGVVIAYAMTSRRRQDALHLLRHGMETRGRLVGKTTTQLGKMQRWHYTFEYEDSGGALRRTEITTDYEPKELEDEPTEALVYDPAGGRPATTLDQLPGSPAIVDGQLRMRNPLWLVQLLPVTLAVASILGGWVRVALWYLA